MQLHAGEDTYAAYHAAKSAATKLAAQVDAELLILDADEITRVSDLLQHLEAFDLFGNQKVVLAKRALLSKPVLEYLNEHWDTPSLRFLVVWHEGKLDKRWKLVAKLQAAGSLFDYPQLKPRDFPKWIAVKAKEFGINLSQDHTSDIQERLGTDKWLVESELHKLSLYLQSTSQNISREIIAQVIGNVGAGDIWRLLDCLATGQKNEAVNEMDKIMQNEDMSQYILTMISRELSLITQVKTVSSPHSLGLPDFVLTKLVAKSRRFTLAKLQKLAYALLRLDLSIKQGRIDPKLGLTLYLLSW